MHADGGGLLERPVLIVGAIMLIGAAIALVFSTQIVGYAPDEVGYTHLAVGISHSLSPITLRYGGGARLNQLYPLLIAPFWGAFGNVTAFQITHVWDVLLMVSAAIPTYLLSRQVVEPRWAGYIAAALVVVMPWMTLSLVELTEVAAFPACAWAFLAMQRCLALPSARRDIIALAAIGLATYGRLQLIVLAPVLVLAMVCHELGYSLAAGGDRRAGLREAGRRMLRLHKPLSVVGVIGVIIGIPLLLTGRLTSVAGFYGNTLTGVTLTGPTFSLARAYLVFLALGLGAVPAALTFGFIGESILAPASRRAHAFATITALSIVVLTIQVAEVSQRFDEGVLQERYLFYLVPLIGVGMCAALLLTRHPVKMAVGGSAVLALLTATTSYESARTAFWYQVSPAMSSFYDWILPVFGVASGPSADPGASRQVLAGVAILVAGILVALLARRVAVRRLLTVVGALVVLFCAAITVHSLSSVLNGVSGGRGYGQGTLKDVDWVDRSIPSGASAEQLVTNMGGLDTSRGIWEDLEFWNRSIAGADTFGGFGDSYGATMTVRRSLSSGAVRVASGSGSGTLPVSYLIVPTRGFPTQIEGSPVSRSADGTLELVRLAEPVRAAWSVLGASNDGWLALGHPATLRLYMLRGLPGRCASVDLTLTLSPITSTARSLILTGAGPQRAFSFTPGQTRTVAGRVCAAGESAPQLTLTNVQGPLATNPQITLKLTQVTVTTS